MAGSKVGRRGLRYGEKVLEINEGEVTGYKSPGKINLEPTV